MHAHSTAPKHQHTHLAVQEALTPQERPLQVDDSLEQLQRQVEFTVETVRALMRRLAPVSVDTLAEGAALEARPCSKVRLAEQIDRCTDDLVVLTAEVQVAVRALQL
jgi:hypothetical protein